MNILVKRAIAQTASFVAGVGLIAANGVFMLTQKEPVITHADPNPAQQTEADESQDTAVTVYEDVEISAADTLSAIDLPEVTGVSKASLDEYTMLVKEDAYDSETELTGVTFEVVYEDDTTTIYDPQPDPLSFTETRSVASEYYTVNDIISGTKQTLNAHELLCEMVYSEIGSSWDEDAIKAQAVAAYSYLRFNDSLGLTPTVGLKTDYPSKIEKCVSAVEGQAVFYNGEIINAVYSASTAGCSVESERIWGVYYPYLRAVVSEYDYEDPNYGIEYVYTVDEVREILEDLCSITLSDDTSNWFSMEDIYSTKYVGYITIDGQKRITASELKSAFGLKSQAITVSFDGDSVTFKTYGWGHGVGMSQWGACYYAKHGYTYDQILRHYYLNTTIALSSENAKAVARGQTDEEDEDTSATDVSSQTDDTSSAASDSSSSVADSSTDSSTADSSSVADSDTYSSSEVSSEAEDSTSEGDESTDSTDSDDDTSMQLDSETQDEEQDSQDIEE